MKYIRIILFFIFLSAVSQAQESGGLETRLILLECQDAFQDQDFPISTPLKYQGGDILKALLTVEEIPIPRSAEIADYYPPALYVPIKLEIKMPHDLTGGEIQRNIYISLPPLFIEHISVRNSFLETNSSGQEEQILLNGQLECSFFTGMDERFDLLVESFRQTEIYKNCAFDAPFQKRYDSFKAAQDYSIHENLVFYFPHSPTFHWKEIPPVSISSSMSVCEIDHGKALGISMLISDDLKSEWTETPSPTIPPAID